MDNLNSGLTNPQRLALLEQQQQQQQNQINKEKPKEKEEVIKQKKGLSFIQPLTPAKGREEIGRPAIETITGNFIEGMAYSQEFIDTSEQEQLVNPLMAPVARMAGETTRMIGEVVLSAGFVQALKGASYVQKALQTSKLYGTAGIALTGMTEGAVYSALELALAPDSRKPTPQDTLLNIAQFGAGDVARGYVKDMVVKYNWKPGFLTQLLEYTGDSVAGALAGFTIHGDIDEATAEIVAPQAIAIGVGEALLFAISKGKLNDTPEIQSLKRNMEYELAKYNANPTPYNETLYYNSVDLLLKRALPDGMEPGGFSKWLDDLNETSKLDIEQLNREKAGVQAVEGVGIRKPTIEKTKTLKNLETSVDKSNRITSVYTNYDSTKVQDLVDVIENVATKENIDPNILYGLAQIETNMGNNPDTVGNNVFTLLESAQKDVWGEVKPEMTLEEATIGASRYYKLVKSYVRRTGIDMKTDYAIAAYFAGHSTVVDQVKKHGGLTDEVIAGQISTKEYVRRYHKAIKELNGTYVPDIELIGGLQEVLSSLGYYKGKIDGIHGKATEEAIKAYQRDLTIPDSGKIDKKTKAKLREYVKNNYPVAISDTTIKPIQSPYKRVGTQKIKKTEEFPTVDKVEELPKKQSQPPIDDIELTKKVIKAENVVKNVSEETPAKRLIQVDSTKTRQVEFKNSTDAYIYDLGKHFIDGDLNPYVENWYIRQLREDFGLNDKFDVKKWVIDYHNAVNKDTRSPKIKDADSVKIEQETMRPNFVVGSWRNRWKTLSNNEYRIPGKPKNISFDEFMKKYSKVDSKGNIKVTLPTPEGYVSKDYASYRMKLLRDKLYKNTEPSAIQKKILSEYHKPSNGFSINTTKITAEYKTLDTIRAFADVVNEKIPKQKLSDIKAKAEQITGELGLLEGESWNIAKAMMKSPETVVKLRETIIQNAHALRQHANALQSKIKAGVTPSELEKAQFYYLMDMQEKLTTNLKEINRSASYILNAGRVVVGNSYKNITDLSLDDLKNSVDAQSKINKANQTIKESKFKEDVDRIVNSTDLTGLNKMARKNKSEKFIRALVEYHSSNLLTLWTHLRNIGSQTFNMINEGTVNYIRAGLSMGQKGGMTFSEANARLVGNFRGLIETFTKPMIKTKDIYGIYHGKSAPSIQELMMLYITNPKEYNKMVNFTRMNPRISEEHISGYLDSSVLRNVDNDSPVINGMWKVFDWFAHQQKLLSFGLLEAGDAPFMNAAYHAELSGELTRRQILTGAEKDTIQKLYNQTINYRKAEMLKPVILDNASKQNLKGEELQAYSKEIFKKILGVENPYDVEDIKLIEDLDAQAMKHANDMTWKGEIDNSTAKKIEKMLNSTPELKLFIPFFKTPTKIMEKWAYSSGLKKKFWMDITGKNGYRAKEEAMARFMASMSLYSLGAMLYLEGHLTPTARNNDERRAWQDAGIQENSILLGDKWVNFNVLDPAPAMYLSTSANVLRVWQDVRDDEDEATALTYTSEMLFAMIRNITDKTWTTSVRDFINAFSGVGTDQYLAKTLDTYTPFRGLASSFSQSEFYGLNPFYKDYLEETDKELKKLDKPRLDSFGKPRTKYKINALGLRVSDISESPIRKELANLGISLSKMPRSINGIELSEQQYWNLQESLETKFQAEKRMNKLVTSSAYKSAPTELKKEIGRAHV